MIYAYFRVLPMQKYAYFQKLNEICKPRIPIESLYVKP